MLTEQGSLEGDNVKIGGDDLKLTMKAMEILGESTNYFNHFFEELKLIDVESP
jgi:hypothetical protein